MMSGKARALILVLWFYLSCGTLGLLVQRHVQGDIFQNLGTGTGFCTQRNAVCSLLQLDGECEDSRAASEEATCPSCVCQNGFRYNAELDFCEEGKACKFELRIASCKIELLPLCSSSDH